MSFSRNTVNPAAFSVMGVTFTLSSNGATDQVADLILPPFKPWDAMICISQCALDFATRLQDEVRAWWSAQTGATRFNNPQQPVIPLGVDCPAFTPQPAQRSLARDALGLAGDETVFLFAGRLSFHAKAIFAAEVRPQISDADWARVHFLGHIAYEHFIPLLQLSTVHVYLTYPFVLSWSLLEAMSVGCAIVVSDTQPLLEAIQHDETGRLVNFFDVAALTNEVCALLDDAETRARLGQNAREFAQANYDLKTVCLPRQLQWVQGLVA